MSKQLEQSGKSPLYIGFDVGSIPTGQDVAVHEILEGVIV